MNNPIKEKQWNIVLESLGIGLSVKDACCLAGISRETFYTRCEKDLVFNEQQEKMQLKLKTEALENIKKHSKRDYKASCWLLERKHSTEFGAKSETKLTGELNHKMSLTDLQKSLETLEGENAQKKV